MHKLDQTETLVTIGDMTYVREVTETDFYNCMCLHFQFDTFCIFSEFICIHAISSELKSVRLGKILSEF